MRKKGTMRANARDKLDSLLIEYGGRCAFCRTKIIRLATIPRSRRIVVSENFVCFRTESGTVERLPFATVEHVIPLSRGGTNERSNLRPACTQCNLRRNNKRPTFLADGIDPNTSQPAEGVSDD